VFRTFARKFLPNRLDWMLKRAAKRGERHVVLGWNRGLGDIALGLYAIVHRIRQFLPEAKITFVTRPGLKDGFSMLPGVECLVAPGWQRGKKVDIKQTIKELGLNVKQLYIVENPSPTDWCQWQRGTLVPRLRWDTGYEDRWKRFDLPEGFTYIGVQVAGETNYGLWRNWPPERWNELFDRLAVLGSVRVLLFGQSSEIPFSHPMLIDLRGKTSLFDLLSLLKNRCSAAVLPDSGILSLLYYLDASFPLRVVSLWCDSQGVLKQAVPSPNPQLVHCPLIGEKKNLSSISADRVFEALFPKLLRVSKRAEEVDEMAIDRAACVILAGGQGSRLGFSGPKGLFPLLGKSLFQYQLEKIPREMPVAVMVSPLNQDETLAYFEQHQNFGRDVTFLCQEMLPLLDDAHRPAGEGPDGNGGVYSLLASSALLDRCDDFLIIPIDNPLADPADQKLLSHHRKQRADVTIKCIERKRGESMGILIEQKGQVRIAEYFEGVPESEPSFSYTGQLVISRRFVEKAAAFPLPYRWVRKKSLWKREKFLFDAFPLAEKIETLCYPRKLCYAPIKGPENIPDVERLLQERM